MVDDTSTQLTKLNAKLDSIVDAILEMEKSQKQTAETMSMLTEEFIKLQKIVSQMVK